MNEVESNIHACCVLVSLVKPVEEWEAGPVAKEDQATPFTWNHADSPS